MKPKSNATGTTAISYIRFSSRKQAPGATVQRQIELTRDFCQRHNLTLDESRSILDPALSAFRGDNTAKGNLAAFIAAVRAGTIESGIVLCVEALDRITRQETTVAINLLTELLILGVQIGLVSDDKILTHDKVKDNPTELIVAVAYLMRGHDESRMKSTRTGDAVKRMIEKVKQGKPCNLGGYLPPWIKYDQATDKFITDPEKAGIVQRVFSQYLSGKGTTAIVKDLVANHVKKYNDTTERKAPWRAGGIRSMLYNKQVIGTLKLGGIEFAKYLKPIIEESDFDKVQLMLARNTTRHGKHDGKANNLFNRHIFCSKCGKSLSVHKSGSANYFFCLNVRDCLCDAKAYVKSNEVEQWIFGILLKKAPSILLAEQDTSTAKEIGRLETEIATIKRKRAMTLALIEDGDTSTDDLKPILSGYKTREIEAAKALQAMRVKNSELKTAPKHLSSFLQLIAKDLTDETIRHELKAMVPSIVKRIEIDLVSNHVRVQLINDCWLGDNYLTDKQAEAMGI